MNFKKLERYLRVNLLGRGPRLIKKRIYRAAVSQRSRNTVPEVADFEPRSHLTVLCVMTVTLGRYSVPCFMSLCWLKRYLDLSLYVSLQTFFKIYYGSIFVFITFFIMFPNVSYVRWFLEIYTTPMGCCG